jgi:hypothetical protein
MIAIVYKELIELKIDFREKSADPKHIRSNLKNLGLIRNCFSDQLAGTVKIVTNATIKLSLHLKFLPYGKNFR